MPTHASFPRTAFTSAHNEVQQPPSRRRHIKEQTHRMHHGIGVLERSGDRRRIRYVPRDVGDGGGGGGGGVGLRAAAARGRPAPTHRHDGVTALEGLPANARADVSRASEHDDAQRLLAAGGGGRWRSQDREYVPEGLRGCFGYGRRGRPATTLAIVVVAAGMRGGGARVARSRRRRYRDTSAAEERGRRGRRRKSHRRRDDEWHDAERAHDEHVKTVVDAREE